MDETSKIYLDADQPKVYFFFRRAHATCGDVLDKTTRKRFQDFVEMNKNHPLRLLMQSWVESIQEGAASGKMEEVVEKYGAGSFWILPEVFYSVDFFANGDVNTFAEMKKICESYTGKRKYW
jgi:hypothetical protein